MHSAHVLAVAGRVCGCTLKRGNITLKNSWAGCIMVVQARKSLKRGGCYHSFDCTVHHENTPV